jgi:hypothetical protein
MKTLFRFSFVFAAAISVLSSCTKEKNIDPASEPTTITTSFTARAVETRTVFGTKEDGAYPTLWTENDSEVEVILALKKTVDENTTNEKIENTASLTVSPDGTEATFNASFTIEENMSGPYTYYAISPRKAYVGFSSSNNSINISIPTSQTPLENSVDEDAQILVAKHGPEEEVQKAIDFEFNHATAYAKITLKDLTIPTGTTVTNYTFSAGKEIGGRWYYKDDGSMVVNSGASTITVNPTNVTNNVVWLALAPADLRGSTFKVTVNTTSGPIEKVITFPESGNAGRFQSGHVSPFTINMKGLTPGENSVYTLVKDVADLTLDSEVIIAALDYNFAISTTQNTNNRAQTAVTKDEDGNIENPSDAVQIFKITNGKKGGRFAFYYSVEDVSYYIYAASSSSNYLKTTTTLDDNASWKITIDGKTGEATIIADGSNTHNVLRYNSNENNGQLFSCYGSTSSQSAVAIYKKAGTGSGAITPATKYSVSLSETMNGTISASPTTAEEGETITLTATPAEGYKFGSWTVTDSNNNTIVVANNAFTMPASNVTVGASFEENVSGESVVYTLDGSIKVGEQDPYNTYAKYSDLTQNGVSWNVMGNTTMTPWRIGGKGLNGVDRDIYCTSAISSNISKIEVKSGATASNLTVNSVKISVHNSADDAADGSNAIASKTFTSGIASSTVTFSKEDNTSWANKYYRIVYNVTRTSTSGNGYITFESAVFYSKD